MTQPPELTDRATLLRNRARAGRDALFLHDEAMDELQDRLSMVKKSFTRPAVISGQPGVWQGLLPGARHVADENVLALTEGAQDLVVHAMALHWANDPVGQLIQARRALEPDGLFLGVMLGGQTLSELRAALAEAEAEVMGGLSPRVAPMAEIRDLGALMQRAGFAMPVADSTSLTVTYKSPFHLMRELRAMGEGNALAARHRKPTPRALFARAAEIYAANFPAENGRIRATFELIFLSGWSPGPDQPQPLRPGSAQTRLADALGVPERPLKVDGKDN